MRRYIDVDKLIEFANNTKDKTIDANDIARFPAADVRENVRGEWIKKKGSLWPLATCSVCGELSVEGNKPFCSNCGSYNGGEDDDFCSYGERADK